MALWWFGAMDFYINIWQLFMLIVKSSLLVGNINR